jgi:Skp family chaperone for outer membrane proteins
MKKIILLLMLALPLATMAQQPPPPGGGRFGEGRERLEAIQIAYLTRELNLTAQEAEKFWPVYNKYQAEMINAQRKQGEEDVLDKQQQVLDIRKKYKNDFTKIVGADRTNKLFEAEMRFREMVKRELQNRQKRRN